MHFTPLMHGCNQVHVDAATILSDPMTFLRLIDDYVRGFHFCDLARVSDPLPCPL